jgi:hypothetical protein
MSLALGLLTVCLVLLESYTVSAIILVGAVIWSLVA